MKIEIFIDVEFDGELNEATQGIALNELEEKLKKIMGSEKVKVEILSEEK